MDYSDRLVSDSESTHRRRLAAGKRQRGDAAQNLFHIDTYTNQADRPSLSLRRLPSTFNLPPLSVFSFEL